MRGLTLRNSPMWVQHYLACEGVCIDGIRVESTCNANNDGIDIDGCERVRIANCDIRSGDDALVLKSTLERPCRNVVVTNCVLSSLCNAFKLGTESNGGFENIVMSNCAIYDTRISGIALELVDGGTLEQVSISNVTMHNTRSAIFIRLGDRARPSRRGWSLSAWAGCVMCASATCRPMAPMPSAAASPGCRATRWRTWRWRILPSPSPAGAR